MMRVGIIGFGKIGQLRARLVDEHPALTLDSVCDVNEVKSVACPVFDNYQALLERKPDIVFVCTSNDYLAETVIASLDSGAHVFSEKPPGRNLSETRAMIEAEQRNPRLKLKFGFNHRYHDSVVEALKLVNRKRLGKILAVRGIYGKSGAADYNEQWRNRREISGGGILLDQGIHMLDLLLLFCEDFTEVSSHVSTLFWDIDVEDNVYAILRNERNQTGLLVSTAIQWKHQFNLDIILEEGYLSLRGILTNSRSYGRESLVIARKSFEDGMVGMPDEQTYFFDEDHSWEREIKEFVDCIQEDRPVQVGSSRDALRVMELIYRIYDADPTWRSMVGGKS